MSRFDRAALEIIAFAIFATLVIYGLPLGAALLGGDHP